MYTYIYSLSYPDHPHSPQLLVGGLGVNNHQSHGKRGTIYIYIYIEREKHIEMYRNINKYSTIIGGQRYKQNKYRYV